MPAKPFRFHKVQVHQPSGPTTSLSANADATHSSNQPGRIDSSLEWSQSDHTDSRDASMDVKAQRQSLSHTPNLPVSSSFESDKNPSRLHSSRFSRLKLKHNISNTQLSETSQQDHGEVSPVLPMAISKSQCNVNQNCHARTYTRYSSFDHNYCADIRSWFESTRSDEEEI